MSEISTNSRGRLIGYWIATGLFCAAHLGGGTMDLMRPAMVMQDMARLGYPEYFPLIIGVWKLLGAAALLAPRLPILKEWAYAGFAFDLTGAAISHVAVGDSIDKILPSLILLGMAAASYVLRPPSRRPLTALA